MKSLSLTLAGLYGLTVEKAMRYTFTMNKILGIGGFVFRAKDPKALKAWYTDVLGIVITNHAWEQEAGPTAFEPFAMDSDYFPADKSYMLNFRVSDLEAVIKDLTEKGVTVEEKEEWNSMPEIGKFARVHDPEGNPIELWQPA
jgi:predicted enzyme related to lactoylglutathione lyase